MAPKGRLFFQVDVNFFDSPEALGLSDSAQVLFFKCIAWSKRHMTDGKIPDQVMAKMGADWEVSCEALRVSGLLRKVRNKWFINAYLKWNKSREALKEEQEKTRLRVQKHREKSEIKDISCNALLTPPETETETETLTLTSAKPPEPAPDLPRQVFEHWVKALGKRPGTTRLTAPRRKKITARLAEGYSVEEICSAVDNIARSPFHRGDNDDGREYTDLELICRNGGKLEGFRDMQPKANGKSKRPAAIAYDPAVHGEPTNSRDVPAYNSWLEQRRSR